MNKLFTIKPDPSNIKLSLCTDDIKFSVDKKTLIELGMVESSIIEDEEVLAFPYGYKVPYFNVFYASKVSSIHDAYLVDLIKRILFLNPYGSSKHIASTILAKFTRTTTVESKIKEGMQTEVPVLEHKDVVLVVNAIKKSKSVDFYEPDSERIVMFKKNSKISKESKIKISSAFRFKAIKKYYEQAIHQAAEYLHENNGFLKITNARIKGTELVKVNDRYASPRTISRHMSVSTKRFIEEVNKLKPFRTEATLEKFHKFVALEDSSDWEVSLSEAAHKLNISKSTVVQFQEIRKLIN